VYRFARDGLPPDLEDLRARLQCMDDDALRRFGKAAAFLCAPEANHGKAPRSGQRVKADRANIITDFRVAKQTWPNSARWSGLPRV
jgi:hypothetical protein